MSRGTYSVGKRQREQDKARKKRDKADRRRERRERGPGEIEVVSAEDVTGELPSVGEALMAIQGRARAPRAANAIPARLFVGGLSYDTTSDGLKDAFREFGPVSDAIVMTDRNTGSSRGFGFVTMENRKDAPKAIEGMNERELDGRTIFVNVATERGS